MEKKYISDLKAQFIDTYQKVMIENCKSSAKYDYCATPEQSNKHLLFQKQFLQLLSTKLY